LQREALILFEYEDLSLDEIATVTGVEVGAVKARLHRARQALRRRLMPLLADCAERSS
jgi:RNA polymerase sigma-70 factor (ECF subfamily)